MEGKTGVQSPSGEVSSGQYSENVTRGLRDVLKGKEATDPELIDLANAALTNMTLLIANAGRGVEMEELKGSLRGMAMVFKQEEIKPEEGDSRDAVRVALFLRRVNNRVGSVNEQGQATVKVTANLAERRTTSVNLPK